MSLLPWCVAIPALVAATLLGMASLASRAVTTCIALGASLATAVLCALVLRATLAQGTLTYWFGGWRPGNHVGLGIAFAVEPIGASLALGIALVTAAVLVYSTRAFDEVGVTFDVLMLVHLAAAVAFVYTSDLFDLLVFYELTNVTEFSLVGYKVRSSRAARSALNYGIATSLGAFAIIVGLTLLEGRTGELNGAAISEALLRAPSPLLASCAFGLVASGLLVKSAVPPFHFWFVDAQTVAPTPVGVMFSGIVSVLGFYGLERIWTMTFAGPLVVNAARFHTLIAVLGVGGACAAALLALTAADLKRALAFAVVANTALFAAAGVAADAGSLAATTCMVLGFAPSVAALAMWVGAMHSELGTVFDDEFRRVGRGSRRSMPLAVVALAGLAGLPPVPAALGRALLPSPLAACSVFVCGVVTSRFALAAWRAYRTPADGLAVGQQKPAHRNMVLPATLLGASALACGAIPWRAISAAATSFVDPRVLGAALLHHPVRAPGPAVAQPSFGQSLSLTVAVIVVAAIAAQLRPVILHSSIVRAVHGVHTGSVGDYVTWLVGGTAAIVIVAMVLR